MDGYNFPRHALLYGLIVLSLLAATACNVLGEQDDGPAPATTVAEPTTAATETAPPSATAMPTPTTTLAPTPTLPPPTPEIRGQPVLPAESPFVDGTDDLLPDVVNVHYGVDFADVDGDGSLDIWVADCGRVGDQLLLNEGDGRLADVTRQRLSRPGAFDHWERTSFGQDVAFVDVDGDGDADAYVNSRPHSPTGSVWAEALFINDGSGGFVDEIESRLPTDVFWQQGISGLAAFGDVNGDGFLDVIATQFREVEGQGTHHPVLLLNDGQGAFGPAQTIAEMPAGTIIQDMGLADVDGDGDGDLYVGTGVPPHEGEEGMVGGTQKDNLFVNTLIQPEVSQ